MFIASVKIYNKRIKKVHYVGASHIDTRQTETMAVPQTKHSPIFTTLRFTFMFSRTPKMSDKIHPLMEMRYSYISFYIIFFWMQTFLFEYCQVLVMHIDIREGKCIYIFIYMRSNKVSTCPLNIDRVSRSVEAKMSVIMQDHVRN